MDHYSLVLSGGGMKGAFEIGVWKALREQKIKIPCVIGSSIGAINAALIAQNEFDTAVEFWWKLTINEVLKLNNQMAEHYVNEWSEYSFSFFKNAFTAILFRGGLDISPLRQSLQHLINEDKIRQSPTKLGLVTLELKTLKPIQLMIEDIPKGQLIDYLLASAALPVFCRQEIGGKTYLDGGFCDVLPVNFMLDAGYKKIIVVEIPAPGLKKRLKSHDADLLYIKNSEYLGLVLEFDQSRIHHNIQLGYYDSLRALNVTIGKIYYLLPGHNNCYYEKLGLALKQPPLNPIAAHKVALLLGLEKPIDPETFSKTLKKLAKTAKFSKQPSIELCLIESAAHCVGLPQLKEYTPDALIMASLKNLKAQIDDLLKQVGSISALFSDDQTDKHQFVVLYVLFLSLKESVPLKITASILKYLTPESTLALICFIYIHQVLNI